LSCDKKKADNAQLLAHLVNGVTAQHKMMSATNKMCLHCSKRASLTNVYELHVWTFRCMLFSFKFRPIIIRKSHSEQLYICHACPRVHFKGKGDPFTFSWTQCSSL